MSRAYIWDSSYSEAINSNNDNNNSIKMGYKNFSKEDIQMANWYTKVFSTLIIIKAMKVKMSLMYHFTLTRRLLLKRQKISVGEHMEERELS
jgi:hypothetical protein